MVINAVCPHCKRVYPVDEQYAGQTFSCETCGNPFTVPAPGVVQPVAAVPAMGVSRPTIEYGATEISRERRLAARICFVLAGLMYLGVTCVACGGVLIFSVPNAAPPGAAAGLVATVLIVIAVIAAGVATTYLVCGLNIRKGGFISAVIALVLASLHEVLILIGIAASIIQAAVLGRHVAGPAAPYIIQMVIQGILCLAVGQLIYYLIKVVREPRA